MSSPYNYLELTMLCRITEIAIMNSKLGLKGMWWALCGASLWLDTNVWWYTARFLVMKGQKRMDTCHNEIGLRDPNVDVICDPFKAWNDHTLQKQKCSVILSQDNMGELVGTTKWHIGYCMTILNAWVVSLWKFYRNWLLIKVCGPVAGTSNSSNNSSYRIYSIMKIATIIQFSIVGVV